MTVPIEIERRFLVVTDGWREAAASPSRIRQGYLPGTGGLTMRVRREDGRAYLAIKGARQGVARVELEYEIPTDHADFLLASACDHPPLEKTRYRLRYGGLPWVVDEYRGANSGLVIAEAELERADQPVPLPPWAGAEVTGRIQFRNSFLAHHPFVDWGTPAASTPALLFKGMAYPRLIA